MVAGMRIFLYGPPGSGKSTVGRFLAENLGLPFFDLDVEIEATCGLPIPEIFRQSGEAGFREMESKLLQKMVLSDQGVFALGGGALLDDQNRQRVEQAGEVICLTAPLPTLLKRLSALDGDRPLLEGLLPEKLSSLLEARRDHYASFGTQINANESPEEIAWKVQVQSGHFRVTGMGPGYPVAAAPGELSRLGAWLEELNLHGPFALVCDSNTAQFYANPVVEVIGQRGATCSLVTLPSGEMYKTMDSVAHLWESFLVAGLERNSTVIALGGGVVTDLAGFAASTYLRGVRWVAVPSTLLGMVDAALGGKTGFDMPQGKNLVGSFHPPSLVLADPDLFRTLPEVELRNGLAEALKHGIIGDRDLFEECVRVGNEQLSKMPGQESWSQIVRRAMAVKIRILVEDPFERNRREVLNLGHTVGHAIEYASHYQIRHGEAVAIGLVVESRSGEASGITQPGVAEAIEEAVANLGLPTRIPNNINREKLRAALRVDKKRRGGKLRLPLPIQVGEARHGYKFDEEQIWSQCLSCMART